MPGAARQANGDAATKATVDRSAVPLPVPRTTLFGRDQGIARLRELLQHENAALITITGPGGVGKTRLALAAARALRDTGSRGIAFVPLAPVDDPERVTGAILHTLGVPETPGQPPLDLLTMFMRPRRRLLILDNFEHLLAAAPLVADLLARCPRLIVLVTSRAPLHLSEEVEFSLAPLPLPRRDAGVDDERLRQNPAVALFCDRAAAARPAFALTAENAEAVRAICLRLDGLPLALELAAARIRLFAPRALLQRLDGHPELLGGGPRDAPARQQTLNAAIAWSYELLWPPEQRLLLRLAVFAEGWTVELAEAICAAEDDTDPAIFERLSALVDQSLLQVASGPDGEPVFTMLETVRAFTLERLAQGGETERLYRQHARACLDLAEAEEPLRKASLSASLSANLGAALERMVSRGEAELSCRLFVVLRWLFSVRYVNEGW